VKLPDGPREELQKILNLSEVGAPGGRLARRPGRPRRRQTLRPGRRRRSRAGMWKFRFVIRVCERARHHVPPRPGVSAERADTQRLTPTYLAPDRRFRNCGSGGSA